MRTLKRNDIRFSRTLAIGAVLALGLALGATTANAQTATSSPEGAPRLHLGVSTPLIVPFGYSASVGVGVLPGLRLALGNHFAVDLTGGYIHYLNAGEYTEREIPVLAGVTVLFMDPHTRARPYVTAKVGYTNSRRDGHREHWLTAAAGAGALIRLGRGFAADVGVDLVVADVTGKADETVGLLLKIGFGYRI